MSSTARATSTGFLTRSRPATAPKRPSESMTEASIWIEPSRRTMAPVPALKRGSSSSSGHRLDRRRQRVVGRRQLGQGGVHRRPTAVGVLGVGAHAAVGDGGRLPGGGRAGSGLAHRRRLDRPADPLQQPAGRQQHRRRAGRFASRPTLPCLGLHLLLGHRQEAARGQVGAAAPAGRTRPGTGPGRGCRGRRRCAGPRGRRRRRW